MGLSVLYVLRLVEGISSHTLFSCFRCECIFFGFSGNDSDGSEDMRGSNAASVLCVLRHAAGIS